MKNFTVGSTQFFSKYPDFKSKDIDILSIQPELPTTCLHHEFGQLDVFLYQDLSKEEWIKDAFDYPMKMIKFLNPEFCKYINFTVEELPVFQELIDTMDEKHKYVKIIYDAYLKNKDFTLTDEQLDLAYKEYKLERKNPDS